MNLRILNRDLNAIAILDTYESFIWTDRYRKAGDFELRMAMDVSLLEYIRQDNYIQILESDHLMVIEKIQIESNAEDGDRITATGRSLESILDRRIVWGDKIIKGNLQDGVKSLLNENVISPSNSDRKISNFVFKASTDSQITKLTIDARYTGENLYEVIANLCLEHHIGFRIIPNDSNQLVFELYAGADRSYEQTALPAVVFSPNFDNISNSNYMESKTTLKNVTLVGGELAEDDSVVSETTNTSNGTTVSISDGTKARKYVSVGTGSGLDRREIFTNASDISTEVDGETLSDADYEALLKQRGNETLAENVEIDSFEGQSDNDVMYKYGRDFFNGDLVQFADAYGREKKVRIIEVIISHDSAGNTIYPTFETFTEEGA